MPATSSPARPDGNGTNSANGASAPSSPVKDSLTLFASVHCAINDSIPPKTRIQLSNLLTSRGATLVPVSTTSDGGPRWDPASLTHFITDTLDFPERSLFTNSALSSSPSTSIATLPPNATGKDGKELSIVTPYWVTKSYDLQTLQSPRHYSADRSQIFSGLCFCCSELPDADVMAIQAGVEALGGQFRMALTREVTHLFVVSASGQKYEAAMKYGPELGMVVVLPHWFEECIKLSQTVPTFPFAFPDPPISSPSLYANPTVKSTSEKLHELYKTTNAIAKKLPVNNTMTSQILGASNLHTPTADALGAYQKTAVAATPALSKVDATIGTEPIFAQRTVYLAGDLGLSHGLEAALKQRIEDAGGRVWSWQIDGDFEGDGASTGSVGGSKRDSWERKKIALKELSEANVVVVKYREGWEYWQAYEQKKTIGNLAWIYNVLSTSRLSPPLDRLLHYPTPAQKIPEFQGVRMTISNYSGAARDYVRGMIELMGASFDGSMSKTTSFVITASDFGQKVKAAKSWDTPVLTHLWLEQCFRDWRLVPPTSSPAFISSAVGTLTSFPAILGTSPLPLGSIEAWASRPDINAARLEALKVQTPIVVDGEAEEEVEGMEVDEEVTAVVEEARSPPKRKAPASKAGSASAPRQASHDRASDHHDDGASKPKVAAVVKRNPVASTSKQAAPRSSGSSTLPEHAFVSKSKPAAKSHARSVASAQSESSSLSEHEVSGGEEQETVRTPAKSKPKPTARPGKPRAESLSTDASSPRPSQLIDFNTPPALMTGKRRSAQAANDKLKLQMPDANKFALELRQSGKKRKRDSMRIKTDEPEEAASETESRGTRKQPPSSVVKAKGKKKMVTHADVDSESEEDEEAAHPKPVKPAQKKKRVAELVDEKPATAGAISSFDNPPHAVVPKKVPQRVRLLATGLDLTAESKEIKSLIKLGAEWCENAKDVTHLVTQTISRTEKFLTALGNAPYIITKDWITASIKAKKLLPEAEFLLKDLAKERELGERLVDIVKRAKKGKLFQGKTFFITPKIRPSIETLTNVIYSSGGHVSKARINEPKTESRIRNSDDLYVISCAADRNQWDRLSSGADAKKIFSVEAIFASVLYQKERFFDEFRVDAQLNR